MRRQLRLLSLMIALCALFQVQTVIAQNQNVLFLPGTNATSSLTVPVLNSKITTFPFTIEMWVKPNTITPYGGFFFDKSGGTVKTCFQFANSSTGEMRFDLLGGANIVPLTAAKKLVVNKWQHLAVTVYKDSAVVEIDGSFYSAAHTKLIGAFGSAVATIGLDVDVANRTFNGYMDEVRIWKSARSRSEITLYKDSILNPAAQADLVAYYNFNDLTANDATANALNATKNLTAAIGNLTSDGRLGNLNATGGLLTPTFNPDTLNYAFYAPHGVTVTGVPIGEGAVVTNGSAAPSITSPNFTMVSTSKDGLTTKTYNVNTTFMPFSSWDADGKTGIGSEANLWGWGISDAPLGWGQTNGSFNRYQDMTSGWSFNNGTTTAPWTGRLLYIRWDGTGGTTINSIFSYPMYLEGCKTYELNTKYAWVNNSTVPTATFTISKDRLATNSILTETALCSSTKQLFQNKKMVFTPTTSGIYYFTCKANTASLMALGDLTLAESTVAAIYTNLTTAAFSDATKSYTFFVTGNLLTDTIKLTAPAGILLSKSYILASDAPCGVEVTATYDYTQPITTGNITLTSGAVVKNVALTYSKPSINVYEQDVEVENNGIVYPLNVTSVNNTVDSLYVTASTGLTLVKSAFSNADFVAGAGKIKVNVSSTVSGTTGTLIFSTKKNVPASNLDTVNVTAVAPYTRVYIKHKASSLVMGSFNTGLYPALTAAQGLQSQKFILRRTNPLSLTDTTYYILQDSAYRAVKKIATSAWDTEFGLPSNEAKWTIQQKGNGVLTLTNTVTGKVLGTDAGAVNGRMYDDKTWVAGNNTEWMITQIPVLNVSSKVPVALTAYPGISNAKTIKVGGTNLSGNIKLALSGTNANLFKLSYDTLAPIAGVASDSTLTITFTPLAWSNGLAKLTISTSMLANVEIDLSGIAMRDYTSSIVNPTIEGTSNSAAPNGWTVSKGTGNTFSTTGQHYSGVTTNRYLDSWNGTAGSMIYNASQVIKSIPNGIYNVSAAARTSGAKSYIFANDKQTEIINNGGAGGALSNGWNTITVEKVAVLDSTITIGAKTVTGWTGTWFSVDDFKLQYISLIDSVSYKPIIDNLIATAKLFDLTTSPNGEDAILLTAIAKAEAVTNLDSMLVANANLKKALDTNLASVAPYDKLKKLIASSTTLSTTTSYNAAALITFKAAISAADGVYNGLATLTANVDTAITTLSKALYAYKILQPAPADFTFVLANPSFEEGTVTGIDPTSIKKNGAFNTPKGWNVYAVIDTLATGANFVNISGSSMADGNNGYETWVQGGFNKSINVSQKIVAPGSGFYYLTANARCDASSASMTDPLKWDAHLYAEVPNKPQFNSKKLAEMPGLITGSGWNTKAAWRTLTLAFSANAGDTIKLGLASTSFMQIDNFTLAYRGNNNPATIDIAYITKVKPMDALADSVQNDPVYRMLKQDTLLNVTLKAITDISAAATIDQSSYDALIIQESLGGGDAILFPANALGLPKLSVPTLYNKTYAFKAGRALVAPAAGSATGAEATFNVRSLKVDSINKLNPLFNGITFVADTVQLFTALAQDNGAAPHLTDNTKNKALNVANNVTGISGTLLAYPTGMTPSLCMNDIPAGDTLGGQILKSRIITFGMNFGTMCRDHGQNMTNANYTLWRNAVYSLVGLTIPNTPMNVVTAIAKPAEANGLSVVVYPNPTTSNINIANLNLNSTVKIFNMTGQQVFNGKANAEVMTVDMSRYSNGIYMLQVVSNGKTMKSKIIKK